MLQVERKQKRPRLPHARQLALLLGFLALVIAALVLYLAKREQPAEEIAHVPDTSAVIASYDAADVSVIGVTLRDGESWLAVRQGEELIVQGDDAFSIDPALLNGILLATSQVETGNVLTEDAIEWQDRLADFGLDNPRMLVEVGYADGESITLRIGNRMNDGDETYYYLSVDDDPRLMTLDVGTEEELDVSRPLLRAVTQPVIHKARLDSITLTTPTRVSQWVLDGAITDADAADRWVLIQPLHYAADGESISNLRTNLENFTLGAWEAEATEENLLSYGFDAPRLIIDIHMAAGSLSSTGVDSTVVDYEASSLTLTVGKARTELTDYVLWDGNIYVASRFSLNGFLTLDPYTTLNRYPVLTSLSNLRSLTVEKDGESVTYEVSWTETVNPDNSLATDEDGNTLFTASVTRNGEPMLWESFESAYQNMLLVTVSGTLPEGWTASSTAHTRMVFRTRTGVEHSIALYSYDALHDGVEVDGAMVFYLVKNGLRLAVDK